MSGLTAREQRLVALGLLVAVLAASWFGVAGPILHGFDTRQEARVSAQSQLQRNARLIASLGRLKAQVAAERRTAPVYALSGFPLAPPRKPRAIGWPRPPQRAVRCCKVCAISRRLPSRCDFKRMCASISLGLRI